MYTSYVKDFSYLRGLRGNMVINMLKIFKVGVHKNCFYEIIHQGQYVRQIWKGCEN